MPKRKKRKKIEHGAFSKLASFTSSAIKEYKHNQKLKQQQLIDEQNIEKLRSKDFEFIKDRDERCRLDIRR